MTKKELEKTHEKYDEYIDRWTFYGLAYEGGRNFIEEIITRKSTMESESNFEERKDEAINFNYCAGIIDLFNFYLTEKDVIRSIGGLENDKQWAMFKEDCDFSGTNFKTFMNEQNKLASAYGSIGVLVDKPTVENQTVEQEIANRVYPYCSLYTLPNILNWEFDKDPESGRPRLINLKLKEGETRYRIWTLTSWELWEVVEEDHSGHKLEEAIAILKDAGDNPLNEIPFTWIPNMVSLTDPFLGVSDIKDVTYIVASIVRNISMGDEVIKFAGFPMMRVPMEPENSDTSPQDLVGAEAVKEFDPEHGAAGKPDWMETKIEEPITAILNWIDRKVDEAFRVCHLSGVHGQRKSNNEVASGLALRYEFQQLSAVLSKKAEAQNEGEKRILTFWLKWQGKKEMADKIEILRSKNFSVDDLASNLENHILAMGNVASQTFAKRIQESVANNTLPDLPEDDKKAIKEELEANVTEAPPQYNTGSTQVTWLSNQA